MEIAFSLFIESLIYFSKLEQFYENIQNPARMTKIHRIPRGANSGVTFLGVELRDTSPLIISIFISLPIASGGSWWQPLTCILIGFVMTRNFINFKKLHLNGYFHSVLYSYSFVGYSSAFNKQNKLFIGNSIILNSNLNSNIKPTDFDNLKLTNKKD